MDEPQARRELLHEIDQRQDSLLDQLDQLNHLLECLIKAALSDRSVDSPSVEVASA